MADQLTYYRACRIQPATGRPFRARDVFLEEHDHAAVRDEVWTVCGVGAYDLVPIPFDAEPRAFARPPRCPACAAGLAGG